MPYRTGTVIRNSNQMQNLLQMNNLDMEEHQAGLEKEQIKQTKVGEVLSNKPEIKEPKKHMKNVFARHRANSVYLSLYLRTKRFYQLQVTCT